MFTVYFKKTCFLVEPLLLKMKNVYTNTSTTQD